jgi:membrane protein YdbS with pleckstrin-like domain
MSTEIVYASKVDWWVPIVMVASPLIPLGIGIACLIYDKSKITSAILLSVGVLILVLYFIFALPCKYAVRKDELIIRCGVMRKVIRNEDIKSVELSSDPTSSPALSLQRVAIQLKSGGRVLVSPADRKAFMAHFRQND